RRFLDAPLLYRRKDHRGTGKQAGAMALHELRSRSPESDKDVWRVLGKQGVEIGRELGFGVLVPVTRGDHRKVLDVKGPGRLLLQLLSERLRIGAPGTKILTIGLKHDDALGFGCSHTDKGKEER